MKEPTISEGSRGAGTYGVSKIIDVRRMEKIPERLKKVSGELDGIEQGDYAEIVADDERMLNRAPQMIKSISKAKFIKLWKTDDGYFHTLVEKL